jgi:hypothetical protein
VLLLGILSLMSGFTVAHAAEPKKHIVDVIVEEADEEIAKAVAKEKAAALKADPKKLAQEKVEVARKSVEARFKEFLAGRVGSLDIVLESANRLMKAELQVAENDEERLAAYERIWKLTLAVELLNKARFDAGRVPIQEVSDATYARIEAQERWLKARTAKEKK